MERQRPWSPLRRVGGTRVTYCLFVVIGLCFLLPFLLWHHKQMKHNNTTFDSDKDNSTTHNRTRRTAVKNLKHDWLYNHPDAMTHVYSMNMWWRYAKYVAKSKNISNCYVCSQMPASSQQPCMRVSGHLDNTAQCFISMTSRGYYGVYEDGMNSTECSRHHPMTRFSGDSGSTSDFVTHAEYPPTIQFKQCYSRNGSHPVGSIPFNMCTYTFIGGYITWASDKFIPTNPTDCPPKRTCITIGKGMMPQANGTYSVEEGWWLCGHSVYASLPPNWGGVCAPVHVTDNTFIISTVAAVSPNRTKRETGLHPDTNFAPHDSVWGSNVPDEFKHAGTNTKVLWGLFPWTGVGKNILRIETVDYRFKSFVNMTLAAVKGIREELTSLRLMTMQNRMVLDQLTAAQGGVCAIVGENCCTFIPENDADGHIIAQAILNMTKLQDAMAKDATPEPDFLFRLWHTWKSTVISISFVILAFIIFVSCFIPIARRLISSLLTKQMVQYQMIIEGDQKETDHDWFPTPDHTDHSDTDSVDDFDTQV